MPGSEWRELAAAAAQAAGAAAAVCHWGPIARSVAAPGQSAATPLARAQPVGEWRREAWLDEALTVALPGWSPPSHESLDIAATLASRVMETPPLAGLGVLDAAVAAVARGHLAAGAALAALLDDHGGQVAVVWLGLTTPLAPARLAALAWLVAGAAAKAHGHYRRLFAAIPTAALVTDLEGTIVDSNTTTAQTGYTRDELCGQSISLLFLPGERERFRERLSAAPQGQLQRFEVALRHRSGEQVLVDMMASLVRDDEGRPVQILGIGRDLREERRLDHQRRLEAVGQVVSGVTHELNNPLLTVVGNAEMLAGMKLPVAARRRAERVLAGARRCQDVMDGLLRLKTRRKEEIEPVELESLLRRAVRTGTAEVEGAPAPVELLLPADLPVVLGDAVDLERALAHVVRNALQAVSARVDGRIVVRATVEGDVARLEVADNGPGMSAEVLRRAFEPFFTTREVGTGKGLGLSIALGIVQDHGGQIELRSDAGGAHVLVTLPLRRAADRANPPAPLGAR